jgi:hypothetical protein
MNLMMLMIRLLRWRMIADGVADSGEEPVVGVEREEWPRCLQELDGLSRTHYRMHRSLD